MLRLPSKIKVKVNKEKSGIFFAELTEYDVFTEANSLNELIINVNDLIYTYFDLPKRDRDKIRYMPPLKEQKEEKFPVNPILFSVFTKTGFAYSFK